VISEKQQSLLNTCLPDLKNKEAIWNLLVYKDKEMFLDEYEALMIGFARRSQYNLLKKYFKHRFFEDFTYVKNYHSNEYAAMFFKHLSPKFVVNEKIKHQFVQLQKNVNSNQYELFALISNCKKFFYLAIAKLDFNMRHISGHVKHVDEHHHK
jgi:hypothetical protein